MEGAIGLSVADFEYYVRDDSTLTVKVEIVKNGVFVKDKCMAFAIGGKRSRFSNSGMGIFRIQRREDRDKYSYHFDLDQGASYGATFDGLVSQKSDSQISDLFNPGDGVIYYAESDDSQSRITISAKITPGVFDGVNPSLVRLLN